MRAIGIVRVSQRDDDAVSPEVQVAAMVARAEERGWTLSPRDVLDENVDDLTGRLRNTSGSWGLEDRPKLAYAVEEIEAGRAQVLIAGHLDRFFRNFDVQRHVIGRIDRAGGHVETLDLGHVTQATPAARMSSGVMGLVAEYQRETAIERSKAAVALLVARGVYIGGFAPVGYLQPDKSEPLVLDPERAPIVREAFERRAAGATFGEVQAFLQSRGVELSVSGVRKLLANPVYAGEVHFGSYEPNRRAHEAIVERDLLDRVVAMVVPAGRKAKSDRLLARLGVVTCGTCGGRMSVGHVGEYPTYRCAAERCGDRMVVSAAFAERAVSDALRKAMDDLAGSDSDDSEYAAACERADLLRGRREAAARMVAVAPDSEAALQTFESLAAELVDAEAERDRLAPDNQFSVSLLRDWDLLSLDGRRQLIRLAGARAVVSPGRGPDRVSVTLTARLVA